MGWSLWALDPRAALLHLREVLHIADFPLVQLPWRLQNGERLSDRDVFCKGNSRCVAPVDPFAPNRLRTLEVGAVKLQCFALRLAAD